MTSKETSSFPKTSRITQAEIFKDLVRRGVTFSEDGAAIYFRKITGETSALGILIRKKEVKSAVIRNRLKRYVREFYRIHRLKFTGQYQIVIRVLKILPHKDLEAALTNLFSRAEIMK